MLTLGSLHCNFYFQTFRDVIFYPDGMKLKKKNCYRNRTWEPPLVRPQLNEAVKKANITFLIIESVILGEAKISVANS